MRLDIVLIGPIIIIITCIDMDAVDGFGNTPLHITVEDDAFDAMDYLLSMYINRFNFFFELIQSEEEIEFISLYLFCGFC